MKKIVSANYRDRYSPYRWLVREESQAPDQAVAYKEVRLTGNVKFRESNATEAGFGCATVAYCGDAVGTGAEPAGFNREAMGMRLSFDGQYFVHGRQRIYECPALNLGADGSVIIPAQTGSKVGTKVAVSA